MAAALALLGRAAALFSGAQRLLRAGGGSAEKCLSRGISTDERPKRPLTAYCRFLKDNHLAFKQKNPESSSSELLKKLAGAWRELPESQKQAYAEAQKAEWQRYKEQVEAYKAQLTPAQAAALKEERRKRLARRRSVRAKRELSVLGKPKRPRTGFNIFVSENFQECQGITPMAKMKQLFDSWQKLSTSQKQPYLQLAEDDKVRYANEMKSWEAKMVELGREDLLRSKMQTQKAKAAKKATESAKKAAGAAKKAQTAKASPQGSKAKLKKAEE
ncbi:transcription factor A, mitochondrial [Dryobates pubescens]|uniref:transcription factor A, mitochondrial n=1 Tax=Dryobates pubescens TaxID=118200 RepID=UPI0023B93560|nr:transcription factor A, mitochondrial [Dryobates pubescens]